MESGAAADAATGFSATAALRRRALPTDSSPKRTVACSAQHECARYVSWGGGGGEGGEHVSGEHVSGELHLLLAIEGRHERTVAFDGSMYAVHAHRSHFT